MFLKAILNLEAPEWAFPMTPEWQLEDGVARRPVSHLLRWSSDVGISNTFWMSIQCFYYVFSAGLHAVAPQLSCHGLLLGDILLYCIFDNNKDTKYLFDCSVDTVWWVETNSDQLFFFTLFFTKIYKIYGKIRKKNQTNSEKHLTSPFLSKAKYHACGSHIHTRS